MTSGKVIWLSYKEKYQLFILQYAYKALCIENKYCSDGECNLKTLECIWHKKKYSSKKFIWQLQNLSSCIIDMAQLNAIHDQNNTFTYACNLDCLHMANKN